IVLRRTAVATLLSVLRPVEEADVIRHDFSNPASASVLRLVTARLQPPLYGHQAALIQVVGADLRELAPRDDGEEVRLPVALLVLERPVHRDAECRHSDAILGV